MHMQVVLLEKRKHERLTYFSSKTMSCLQTLSMTEQSTKDILLKKCKTKTNATLDLGSVLPVLLFASSFCHGKTFYGVCNLVPQPTTLLLFLFYFAPADIQRIIRRRMHGKKIIACYQYAPTDK